jgi:hypothetical protein
MQLADLSGRPADADAGKMYRRRAAPQQAVLDQIRESRTAGESYWLIADSLNADRIPTQRGGRWYAASVRSVLRTAARWTAAAGGDGPNDGSFYASFTQRRPYPRRADRGGTSSAPAERRRRVSGARTGCRRPRRARDGAWKLSGARGALDIPAAADRDSPHRRPPAGYLGRHGEQRARILSICQPQSFWHASSAIRTMVRCVRRSLRMGVSDA